MPDYKRKEMKHSQLCPKIYNFLEVSSTNDLAKEFIEKKNKIGFAIIADLQTAGKGQDGRFWESPKGGLWSSLAIQPQIELSSIGMIPILSAVGIAKALESFGIKTILKWPNDILARNNRKKIGGILVEGKITQFSLNYLIIGIGLNVNNTLSQFSVELQDYVTTILDEFDKKIDISTLLQRIIQQIESLFNILKQSGPQPLLNEWKKRDNILGMNLIVQTPEDEYKGKAIDISSNGQLVLEISKSKKITISTGTVILPIIKE